MSDANEMDQNPFSCSFNIFFTFIEKEKVHEMRTDEGEESVIADDGYECVKSSAQINEH